MNRSSRNLFWTAAVFAATAGGVLAQQAETPRESKPFASETLPAGEATAEDSSVLAELGAMVDRLTEAGVPDAAIGPFLEVEFENQAVLQGVRSRVTHSSHPRAAAMMARKTATDRHVPHPMTPRLQRLLDKDVKGRGLAGAMAKMLREHHASHPGHPAVQRLAAKAFHALREQGLTGQELVTRFQAECHTARAKVSKVREARREAARTSPSPEATNETND